ncbi:MAG: hypothetical protein EOO47_11700 [Flavobacterium sp.]|nr:MAG: hypothetical protein EOO47_11700 [Flavobacterium sp.]
MIGLEYMQISFSGASVTVAPLSVSIFFVLLHFDDRRNLLGRSIKPTDTSIVPHIGMTVEQENKKDLHCNWVYFTSFSVTI